MKTYLVTGGCGFIGAHLVRRLLDEGHHVRVLDDLSTGRRDSISANVELLVGDVADFGDVAAAVRGVDGCFHLAAIASVTRYRDDLVGCSRVNHMGTVNVLEVARRASVPVVYASSAAVYGNYGEETVTELTWPQPISSYGADKLSGELHAKALCADGGMSVRAFRFFNVYGPGQDPHSPYAGVISLFFDRALAGEPLRIYGDGRQTRDFVYVGDVCRFLLKGMDAEPGFSVHNICTGRSISILDLAELIRAVCGARVAVEHLSPRPDDIRHSRGSPAAAEAAFDIRAETPMRVGLQAMHEAMRS